MKFIPTYNIKNSQTDNAVSKITTVAINTYHFHSLDSAYLLALSSRGIDEAELTEASPGWAMACCEPLSWKQREQHDEHWGLHRAGPLGNYPYSGAEGDQLLEAERNFKKSIKSNSPWNILVGFCLTLEMEQILEMLIFTNQCTSASGIKQNHIIVETRLS